MRADTRIQIIAAGVLIGAVALSATLSVALASVAGRAQLGYADRAEESDPPEVAAAIALGAFRGLFVNILWFRAEQLKQAGRFHEAIELSRTITRLQPRFPRVWGFHAWNMAYNISVATNTAEERWQWVEAGIKLLRDEGIPKNPNEVLLHKELGWIYLHKIQGMNDDANHYYKRQIARRWTILLGPPSPRQATIEESTQICIDRLQRIADSPDTLEELAARDPAAGEYARRIREEAGLALDFNFLRRLELHRGLAIARQQEGVELSLREEERNAAFEGILAEALSSAENNNAFGALVNFVRKQVITRQDRLELPRMIRYTRAYGPLDWRHPATHGLYWALRGGEEGGARINREDFDEVNTDRLVTHAIQELFRWGTIYFDILNDSYVQMLDLDYADAYEKVLREIVQPRAAERAALADVGKVDAEDPNRFYRISSTGYENFLRDLIRIYYRMGDMAKAEETYTKLRTTDLKNTSNPVSLQAEMSLPLREFITRDIEERLKAPDFAQSEVFASLLDAYRRGLLRGDTKLFENCVKYASDVHDVYMREQNLRTMADSQQNRLGGFMDEQFVDVAAAAFVAFVQGGEIGPWQASRMFRTMSTGPMSGLGCAVYDIMSRMQPRPADFTPEWYPEPSGMEEYRRFRARIDAERDQSRKEQVEIEQK